MNSRIHSTESNVKWHASCQNDNEKSGFINDTEFIANSAITSFSELIYHQAVRWSVEWLMPKFYSVNEDSTATWHDYLPRNISCSDGECYSDYIIVLS